MKRLYINELMSQIPNEKMFFQMFFLHLCVKTEMAQASQNIYKIFINTILMFYMYFRISSMNIWWNFFLQPFCILSIFYITVTFICHSWGLFLSKFNPELELHNTCRKAKLVWSFHLLCRCLLLIWHENLLYVFLTY